MTKCADLKTEGDHKWKHISTELSLFVPPEGIEWRAETGSTVNPEEEEWMFDSQAIAMEVRTVQYECSERYCSAKQETKITVNQPGFQRDLDEVTYR